LVAKEGMVGMPVCWGGNATTTSAIIQIPGNALRMKAELLKTEFERGGSGITDLVYRWLPAPLGKRE
jgi:hypothetical protein